ncbi:MAG: putative ATP-dependent helicase lhr [Thermoleophilia bacterium]|nr:putative ATP-dependent helicase lhr [Thermoleophilia bacterium]
MSLMAPRPTGIPSVDEVLDNFHPAVAAWVREQFDSPTEVQLRGWEAISRGDHVLLGAPTGSGKTLAAFLSGIDGLFRQPVPDPGQRLRLLYLSPLRALNYDIERNLRGPLAGIQRHAARLGMEVPDIRVGVRTGDTSQSERQRQKRNPPDIFITTPESLYVMLTSGSRELFDNVQATIIDEIHALASNKRGTHMAFTLERLSMRVREAAEEAGEPARDFQRIGLSATQRPIERIAAFLGGATPTAPRPITIIDTPGAKEHDLQVIVPVDDMTAVGSKIVATELSDLDTPSSNNDQYSIWGALHAELLDHVEAHTSTILFVNSRRLAERIATALNELAARRVLNRHVEAQRERYEAEGLEWTDETEVDVPVEIRSPVVARAHHGSISRETRTEMEELLKAGQLPCIVATSSLELGIDMGAVDLVLLVESPRSVASGLQRIGRAGHNVGDISRGRIYPKHRADLVEAAAVTRLMSRREIEPVHIPELCLDVLAQQIVATCAERAFTVDELLALSHQAWPWRDLSRDQFENLLSLLAGYFPVDELADIKARVVWDRETGEVTTRADAARVAITNAGTIPDRGMYGVFAVGSNGRVGELDEEMVHETRLGDVIVLGSTSWRVEEITRDRVNVSPQPGAIGKPPFWHGEGAGRTVELGRAVGELVRMVATASPNAATIDDPVLAALVDEDDPNDAELMARLGEEYLCDRRAARNLIAFVREQVAAAGAAPDDHTIVIERFRDELGDWRVCILSPFGKPVHAPWAMAIEEKLSGEYGLETTALWSDDGIALRMPDIDELPPLSALLPDPDDIEDLVVAQLGSSAMFASRFREVATRALVLPLSSFRKRSPLWLQRLRAADVLRVAQQQSSFPMILETYRECMRDVFSLPDLRQLLTDIHDRSVRVIEVETRSASPMAASLLFDYTATFLYEADSPSTERKVQALSLDQALLRELLGSGDLRELLDEDAIAEVHGELQRTMEGRGAKNIDQLHDLMRTLGDLSAAEIAERVEPPEDAEPDALEQWLGELRLSKRAVTVRIGDEERWISIEDTGDYVAAFGVQAPRGVPGVFLDPSSDPLARLVGRRLRTTIPFTTGELAHRWGGASHAQLELKLNAMRIADTALLGGFLPGRNEDEWCDPDVLRRLRRRTLAHLRREIEPADRAALARFLTGWHGLVQPPAGSAAATRDVVVQLEGVEASPSQWERDLVAPRMSSWRAQWLDELVKTGQVVWMGRGTKHGSIQVALFDAGNLALLAPPAEPIPDDADAQVLIEHLTTRGANFLRDIVGGTGIPHGRALDALWRLAASGHVTNDSWSTLRAGAGTPAQLAKAAREADKAAGIAADGGTIEDVANAYGASRRSGLRTGRRTGRTRLPRRGPNAGVPGSFGEVDVRFGGRWSMLPTERAGEDERVAAMSEALLDTFGIVTRHSVQARPVPGGFAAVYRALAVQEEIGTVRRGWFVEGLGGGQFALPEAVDRLRAVREPTGGTVPVVVLRANDPAQPFGAILAWPDHPTPGTTVPRRDASSYVVLRDGELLATVSTGGRRLVVWDREAMGEIARALARLVEQRRIDRLAIEQLDDGAVDPDTVIAFADTGFVRTPRGLRATPTTVAEVRDRLRSSRRVRVGDVSLPTHGQK